jgi:shikimate dehydrogenase
MEVALVINTETRLTGLIGFPIIQSHSPVMQNAAFQKCKLNKIYIPIEVEPSNLESVVKGISKMNFDGFNITKPYKIEIMKYLDEVDEYARLIGAVNTVKISNGILKGYNTDGTGFLRSFRENAGVEIEGKNVFILGSGGAARAIAITLALNEVKKIYICNRTFEKAASLAADTNKSAASEAVRMEYHKMKDAINDSHILINTTNVGMLPNIDESPLNENLLNNELIVCDIVYNPMRTKLLRDAEKKGCKIIPGLPMLVYQGVESFEIWTNINAPIDTMFKAAEEASLYRP